VRPSLPGVLTTLGVVLVVVGAVMFVLGGPDGVFYEASYAPLTIGAESVRAFSGTQAVGAGLAVLGLLVLVALAGWRMGRRARQSRTN
jgi:hypothetical protein